MNVVARKKEVTGVADVHGNNRVLANVVTPAKSTGFGRFPPLTDNGNGGMPVGRFNADGTNMDLALLKKPKPVAKRNGGFDPVAHGV